MNLLNYKAVVVFIILFLSLHEKNTAQNNTDAQRAEWIFNIAYGVTWENEKDINTFTIGVFSSENIFKELQKIAKKKKLKGKPVKVFRYTNYKDIKPNHIVYVSKNENAYLGFVYQKLKGKNVLIMSDRSKQPEYTIFNFRKTDTENQKPFDINSKLANINRLKISTQLLKLGGNRETLQKIYAESNRKFIEMQKTLEKQKKEYEAKDAEILRLKNEIKRLKKENEQLRKQANKK